MISVAMRYHLSRDLKVTMRSFGHLTAPTFEQASMGNVSLGQHRCHLLSHGSQKPHRNLS